MRLSVALFPCEVNRNSSNTLAVIAVAHVNTVGSRGYAEAKNPVVYFEHLSFLWFFGLSLRKENKTRFVIVYKPFCFFWYY